MNGTLSNLRFFVSSVLVTASIYAIADQATPPAPNAEMGVILNKLATLKGKPIEKLSASEARRQPTPTDAVKAILTEKKMGTAPEEVAKVEDIRIKGANGDIPARIYKGKDAPASMPVIVYYHGGGWVIATIDTYDASARALANQLKATVISVEYRKAPEHKFPASHDDAFAAYQWAIKNAQSLGGDPQKIAVAGESAGGNLAINVAIKARDTKTALPSHILAVYPVAGNDMERESYQVNANAKPLNKPMMGWFMKQALAKPDQKNDPRLNLLSANLAGLPATTIITAEIDPLMTEGKMLADKMAAAGVSVDYKNFSGVTHEFFGMSAVLKEAKEAQAFAVSDMKESFTR